MAKSLRDTAKEVNGGSPVITGKEKLSTSQVIATYPAGLHICAVDMLKGKTNPYPVFNFTEDATKWFAGGKLATDVVEAWLKDYTLDQINESLKAEPMKVTIKMNKTKGGHDCASFEVE